MRDYFKGIDTKDLRFSNGYNDLIEFIESSDDDKFIKISSRKQKLGSILKFEDIAATLVQFIDTGDLDPNIFLKECNLILEAKLPNIMKRRTRTKQSSKYYKLVEYAVADLIDCTVTWWKLNYNSF